MMMSIAALIPDPYLLLQRPSAPPGIGQSDFRPGIFYGRGYADLSQEEEIPVPELRG